MYFKKDDYGWIDVHNHPRIFGARNEKLDREWVDNMLKAADLLNIEIICISYPLTAKQFVTPEEFRAANDDILKWMKFSDRFRGFCFVNPGWAREACEEIKRCHDAGMIGIKLYHQYLMNDPAQTAVCELAAELGMPILMHAGKVTDKRSLAIEPQISNARHMIEAAERFPQTNFIQGHIGGGGDWEWSIRELERSPENLYVDISGSVHDAEIVRKLVDAIGAGRVLFATDMTYEGSVGKLLDAKVTDAERRMIARANALKIMKGLL